MQGRVGRSQGEDQDAAAGGRNSQERHRQDEIRHDALGRPLPGSHGTH